MVKSDGFLSPPPSLFTFVITIILPVVTGVGVGVGVGVGDGVEDESDEDGVEDESDEDGVEDESDEDVLTSITSLDFLCSSPSDIRDEIKDDNDDIFSLLLSCDSAYEFKSTKVGKANTVAIIKRRKLKANPGVTFGNNILLLLLDYYPSM
jgi:hypothetical protein